MKKLRGRPDSQNLPLHREHLLKVAGDEFLAQGYDGANLDVIARKAGVSKVTIYRRFASKAGLFEAVALRSVGAMRQRSRSVQILDRNPQEVLMEFAEAIYEGSTRRTTVAVMRLAIAEMKNFPNIARMLWDHRFETLAPLHHYLQQLHKAGVLRVPDTWEASTQFGALVTGGLGLMLDAPIRTQAERTRWLKSAVGLFLDGCRVG